MKRIKWLLVSVIIILGMGVWQNQVLADENKGKHLQTITVHKRNMSEDGISMAYPEERKREDETKEPVKGAGFTLYRVKCPKLSENADSICLAKIIPLSGEPKEVWERASDAELYKGEIGAAIDYQVTDENGIAVFRLEEDADEDSCYIVAETHPVSGSIVGSSAYVRFPMENYWKEGAPKTYDAHVYIKPIPRKCRMHKLGEFTVNWIDFSLKKHLESIPCKSDCGGNNGELANKIFWIVDEVGMLECMGHNPRNGSKVNLFLQINKKFVPLKENEYRIVFHSKPCFSAKYGLTQDGIKKAMELGANGTRVVVFGEVINEADKKMEREILESRCN